MNFPHENAGYSLLQCTRRVLAWGRTDHFITTFSRRTFPW